MLKRTLVVVLALGTVLAFPGTSMSDTFRVKAVGSVGNFDWDPSFRHVIKGDRVVWKNTTSATHRVTAYKGPWSKDSELPAGQTTSKRFRKTGSYKYRCTVPGHSSL